MGNGRLHTLQHIDYMLPSHHTDRDHLHVYIAPLGLARPGNLGNKTHQPACYVYNLLGVSSRICKDCVHLRWLLYAARYARESAYTSRMMQAHYDARRI